MYGRKVKLRFLFIILVLISLILAVFLILKSLEENVIYFQSPTEIKELSEVNSKKIRVGGMVQTGSIQRQKNSLKMTFRVIDEKNNVIPVKYNGVVPDLFKEGKGVVAQGKIENGVFNSTEILAKHDENYMPPELGMNND